MRSGIVAGVEELDLRAEDAGRALGLVAALRLHLGERHAGLLPGPLALAALAIGQADDLHAVALARMQRDGAARAPDEVAGMGGDDESGFASSHESLDGNEMSV